MTALEKLQLSQPLTDIYTAMETDLMIAIARQIAQNENNEINATSEWRLKKLAELGALNRETVRIIASYTGIQSETLTETIETAAKGIMERLEPALQACAEDGYISVAESSTPISEGVKNVTNSFRKQATSDLNTVNTVMQYRAGSSYTALVNKIYDTAKETELHGVLGKHAFSVASGAESRQAAVRKCIQEFAEKGIPAFVDKSGREWSPEAYISMDIRTTVSNTANAAQDACCDRYGLDLIEVSSHMGARPLCALDQGKLVSRSNRSGIAHDGDGNEIPFIPLSSTSYGQPAGLFGINCGHKKYPFVDGVNFQSYFPYDEKENAERYKEFQKQREMERNIRKTKCEADMLKETGDEEGAKDARKRLAEQRKTYKEYSSSHGLKPHNDRTSVARMAKGQDTFGDVYKDYGKTVDKAEESGIIKTGLTKISSYGEVIDPMDSKKYEKMKASLEKKGCSVIAATSGSDEERFLKMSDAEAISDRFGIIHMGEVPSASAFFEEIIHYTQIQKYGDVNQADFVERAAREVAANRKLLKHAEAYSFTGTDYQDIQRNLTMWENDFEQRAGVSYDESEYKRDI